MPIALLALTLSAFAIGTTEFVIVGLLPTIGADLGVSLPSAGLLVSLYALGVAIGAPVLTAWSGRLDRLGPVYVEPAEGSQRIVASH